MAIRECLVAIVMSSAIAQAAEEGGSHTSRPEPARSSDQPAPPPYPPYPPYPPPPYPPYPPYRYPYAEVAPVPNLFLRLNLEAAVGAPNGSSALAAAFSIEGQHFGFSAQFIGIEFPFEDVPLVFGDSVGLADFYATFAVVATARVRLRLEAGLMSVFANDFSAVGLGGGLSGSALLWGPLGVEAAVHATPYSFDEFDWSAGLEVALRPIAIRAGWRRIWLNDRGRVDGFSHQAAFNGPYFGISFGF